MAGEATIEVFATRLGLGIGCEEVMPIFFLSGALYPLNDLPTALTIVTRIDPLTYGIDGLRGALLGVSQFNTLTNAGILGGVAVFFLILGGYLFSRIEV